MLELVRPWRHIFAVAVLTLGIIGGGCQQQKKQGASTQVADASAPQPEKPAKPRKKGWFDDWGKPKQPKSEPAGEQPAAAAPAPASGDRKPTDPKPIPLYAVQLEVFQLDVPYRSISANSEFWKRVDEQAVDATAHDVLKANGFRVGQAPVAEWDYFRDILNRGPVKTQQQMYLAYQAKQVELLTRKEVPAKNLFWFAAGEPMTGRRFEESDYIVQLSFWPTPRKNGEVHVKLVPVVRSRSRKLEKYWDGDQEALRIVRPERLYDLKLEADVQPGNFLVIAPSAEATQAAGTGSYLGDAFMVDDAGGDRLETVLIFVAKAVGENPLSATTRPAAGG